MIIFPTTTTTTTSLPRLVVAPIQRHFCPRFIRPTRNKDPTSTTTRRIPTWTNTFVAATLTAAAASNSYSTALFLLSPLPRRHLPGYSPSIHAVAATTPAFHWLPGTQQSSSHPPSLRRPSLSTRRMSASSSSSSSEEDKDNGTVVDYTQFGPLEALCVATLKTCHALTPAIRALYQAINTNTNNNTNNATTTTKADDSILTIADGIVQSLLIETLALQEILGHVVGEEEDGTINLTTKPYAVGETLVIPKEFEPIIDETRHHISKIRHEFQASLSASIAASTATASNTRKKNLTRHDYYQTVTAFIDPIDGTREFATNHGEQCTICVGFAATRSGRPVAGVIYRPLSSSALPPAEATEAASSSWAVGAHEEQYFALSSSSATTSPPPQEGGSFLTTNGRISPFLTACLDELHYHRVPSGGAGNKVLRLLEAEEAAEIDTRRPPSVYIQDRGVSRWDTCAAQAVLEAQGGILYNLERFLQDAPPPLTTTRTNTNNEDENAAAEDISSFSYTYRQTDTNLDFVPGVAVLTKYNAAAAMLDPTSSTQNKEGITAGGTTATTTASSPRFAHTVSEVKPYANLGGLFAVTKRMNTPSRKRELWQALQRAARVSPPAFD